MTNRLNEIKAVAKNNALEALDQGRVEDYRDNMADALSELFQNLTHLEIDSAYLLFDQIINSVPDHKVEGTQAEFDRYIAGDR